MNIKKQLRNLYLYEIINGLQIVDVVWVLLLLERGFSLAQTGIAEGFFHIVSMCCEIPSGMLSDLLGRKKTLLLAGLISAASSLCMIATDWFGFILLAMGLNAFSYNLVSGTREALTYDSLLESGQTERYPNVYTIQETLYLGVFAAANVLSVITIRLGYQKAYLLSLVQGVLCSLVAMGLSETTVGREQVPKKLTPAAVGRGLKEYSLKSFHFLKQHPSVFRRMLLGGVLSAGCYLVYMFMQQHLVECGLNAEWVGIPLLSISLFSMLGAALGTRLLKLKRKKLFLFGGLLAALFIVGSGSSLLILSVLFAGCAHGIQEALMLRIETENQTVFSSEIRATMVSVSSMLYSVFMVILSPAIGWAAKEISIGTAFSGLGLFVFAMVCILLFLDRK